MGILQIQQNVAGMNMVQHACSGATTVLDLSVMMSIHVITQGFSLDRCLVAFVSIFTIIQWETHYASLYI